MKNKMKRNCLFVVAFVLSLVSCTDHAEDLIIPDMPKPEVNIPSEAAQGELLVKFAPEMSDILDRTLSSRSIGEPGSRSGIPSTDEVLSLLGTYHFERVFPVDSRTEERTREAGLHLWYVVRFNEDTDLKTAVESISRLGEVAKVQCNRTLYRNHNRTAFVSASGLSFSSRATGKFNDPGLSLQWGYVNTGKYGFEKEWAPALAGSDVNCDEAWELCTGDPSIIVGVMDEGVMWNHPDLEANMWVNEAETFGSDTDADGNGFKGDRYGYNFATDRGYIGSTGSNDTGHGTHVAGTIAAVNGNGIGVCGIAGGNAATGQQGVKIMSLQIFDDTRAATVLAESKAFKYAADNGAVIIQCSWGYNSSMSNPLIGYTPGPASEEEWELLYPLEKESLDYFIKNAGSPNGVIEGGLAIFASGNEYAGMSAFPGGYSKCVAVSAIAADFTPATYTNFGEEVDLCAPGGDSEYYGTPGQEGDEGGMIYSTWVDQGKPTYGFYDGTSMACPHVSGVAALGLSYAVKLRRHFKADEFIRLMQDTGMDIDGYFVGEKTTNHNHTSPGFLTTKRDMAEYRGKMGRLVDAGALLRAIEGSGSPMKVPNVYVAPDCSEKVDLARYFVDGERLTYSCNVEDGSIASVQVAGTILVVNGVSAGTTTALVKTSNGIEQTITITVRKNANENGWM